MTLDVHRYKEARQKVKDKAEASTTVVDDANTKHIATVRSAQERMQEAEAVFVMPAFGGAKEIHFLATAAQGA